MNCEVAKDHPELVKRRERVTAEENGCYGEGEIGLVLLPEMCCAQAGENALGYSFGRAARVAGGDVTVQQDSIDEYAELREDARRGTAPWHRPRRPARDAGEAPGSRTDMRHACHGEYEYQFEGTKGCVKWCPDGLEEPKSQEAKVMASSAKPSQATGLGEGFGFGLRLVKPKARAQSHGLNRIKLTSAVSGSGGCATSSSQAAAHEGWGMDSIPSPTRKGHRAHTVSSQVDNPSNGSHEIQHMGPSSINRRDLLFCHLALADDEDDGSDSEEVDEENHSVKLGWDTVLKDDPDNYDADYDLNL
ncbi:hypothetical protein C8J57DRAFT_1589026 [Mycena rebaudengoi]|nr:hypothetical protein C8J57DRAFT_1589026 [Mycena rebaudengoi]